ncbi:iron complex outermembrane receptor protein [Fluviicoccus keumensis]|uniref:Iron complex outermembrane receptor protein n=2 Tax=Fluviicoccus keumensis TaxID=1435465 RepID=A0A4V2G676_9GAMM|nr:iron complex outermembrane receptor protein [Fluviicoccus keumensis]
MSRPLVLAILSVAFVRSAPAADVFLPDTEAGEIPTVFSATRLRQSVADAPASISIIDRQMIDQSGAREIPELLRLVPGMVVGYDTGWNAFVSYHGTSADMARRMQVLVDGRSIYQPSLAYVDWIGLPVELGDIDRIEVIRGPNAAAYGANSFLGVVNIITRHPADLPRFRAYTRQGGDGINDSFASVSMSGAAASGVLSVSQRRDNGYAQVLDRNGNPVTDYADNKNEKSLNGKLVMDLGADSSLTIKAGHSELRGQNHAVDPGFIEFLDTHDTETQQDYLGFSLDQTLDSHQLQLSGNYTRFKYDEKLRVLTYPGLMLPELRQLFVYNRRYVTKGLLPSLVGMLGGDITPGVLFGPQAGFDAWVASTTGSKANPYIYFRDRYLNDPTINSGTDAFLGKIFADPILSSQQVYLSAIDNVEARTEFELQDTWTISPTLRVVMGGGIQESTSDSQYYFNGTRVENGVWRLFAHGEWQFRPNWLLNVGVMDEHDDTVGELYSPRVAVNWRFAPTQTLRLVSSTAYRTPDLQESKADWEFRPRTEDRSLSKYDGTLFYVGKTPQGMTCIDSPSHYKVVCSAGAESEKIVSTEIGYYGDFPPSHLTLDVRVFSDKLELAEHNLEIENFVIAPVEPHEQRGVEISGQWRPLPEWRVLANYAYDDITGTNDNTMFVPKHSGNFTFWYENPNGYQASLGYLFYDHLFNNPVETYTRDLHLLNLRLANKWSLAKRHDLELAAAWQIRLTNDHELRKENGAPRDRVWFQLSYAFD